MHQFRRVWIVVHLHLGVWIGVLFALLGLTGSLLVFYLEIDQWLHPISVVKKTQAVEFSFQAILDQLLVAHPHRHGSWRIEAPLNSGAPIMARYYKPMEKAEAYFAPLLVTLDSRSLEIVRQDFWGDHVMTWIYDLHYTLLLGAVGHNTVGWLGLMMACSVLTGLVLWWPHTKRVLKALRPIGRGHPVIRIYDWHVLSGVYFSAILILLATTGAALAFPNVTQQWLAHWGRVSQPLPIFKQLSHSTQPLVSLDQALQVARNRFPNAELRWIETSGEDGRAISIRMHQEGEPGRRFPQTYVLIHPDSGEILHVRNGLDLPISHWLWTWIHPLHNGEVFGITGRFFYALVGVLPLCLWITGLVRWRQKVRARVKGRHRSMSYSATFTQE